MDDIVDIVDNMGVGDDTINAEYIDKVLQKTDVTTGGDCAEKKDTVSFNTIIGVLIIFILIWFLLSYSKNNSSNDNSNSNCGCYKR